MKRRTHFNFLQFTSASKPQLGINVTLVTQLQLNRLEGLERLLAAWEGPASVALYLSDEEAVRFTEFVNNTKVLHSKNVAYHVVYKRQVSGSEENLKKKKGLLLFIYSL